MTLSSGYWIGATKATKAWLGDTLIYDAAALASDEFNGALNAAWVATAPGNSTITSGVTVGSDTVLAMYCPATTAEPDYDIYDTIQGPTLLQPAPNADWQMAGRFPTVPTLRADGYGLLIKADASNYIYFRAAKNVFGDGNDRLQIIDNSGGTVTRPYEPITALTDCQYLRVTRTGDTFTFDRSADNVTWVQAYSYTRAFVPTEIGVAAHGTYHESGDWTAHCDWCRFS